MKKYLKAILPLTIIVTMLIPLTVSADTGDWEPPSNTETYYDDIPLPMGNGAGYNIEFTETQVDAIKTYLEGYGVPTGNIHYIIFNEASTTTTYSVLVFYNAPAEYPTNPSCVLYSGNNLSDYVIRMEGFCGQYYFDDLQLRAGSGFGARFTTVDMNTLNFLNESATGDYSLKTGNLYHYPLYSKFEGGIYDTSTNEQLFTTEGTTPPPTPTSWDFTHAKGGYESAYQDIGDLDDIDNTPPSDASNNSAWYQKILNAIKQSGKNFIAGTLLIAQTMHDDIEGLKNGTKDIKDILRERFLEAVAEFGIIAEKFDTLIGFDRQQYELMQEEAEKTEPSTIASEWQAGYNSSTLKGVVDTGQNLKATLGTIGTRDTGRITFGAWRLEYNGNDLHLIGNYSLPEIYGGGTHQQDLSFAWYNNCRTWVIWVLKAFLYVGFAWYLLHQVPNMIQGAGTTFRNASKGGKE